MHDFLKGFEYLFLLCLESPFTAGLLLSKKDVEFGPNVKIKIAQF